MLLELNCSSLSEYQSSLPIELSHLFPEISFIWNFWIFWILKFLTYFLSLGARWQYSGDKHPFYFSICWSSPKCPPPCFLTLIPRFSHMRMSVTSLWRPLAYSCLSEKEVPKEKAYPKETKIWAIFWIGQTQIWTIYSLLFIYSGNEGNRRQNSGLLPYPGPSELVN